jgi:hypothetical protein
MASIALVNRTRFIKWFETLSIANRLRPSRRGGFYMIIPVLYDIRTYCDLEYTEYKGIYSIQDARNKFDKRFLFTPSVDHKFVENEAVFIYEINLPVYTKDPDFPYI